MYVSFVCDKHELITTTELHAPDLGLAHKGYLLFIILKTGESKDA